MIKTRQVIAAAILCIVSAAAAGMYASGVLNRHGYSEGCKVIMEIDYAGRLPIRRTEITLPKGTSVLAALQAVADVKTHHLGRYVFVVSIDGVEGRRGETAWYYTIDGKDPGELAYSKIIDRAAQVRWSYQKDACSGKVDNNNGPAGKEGDK